MARPLRVEFPGAHYHIMNRGLERRRTFDGEADHQRFLALLEDIHQRWQVEIFAYCCMTNHYHLVLRTPRGNLSRVMRHVAGLFTQHFNRAHKRDGPLFRGRFKAILVDTDLYLLRVIRYVHRNPVEAGLVKHPTAYPWSSYRLYHERQSPSWLARDEILAYFPSLQAFDEFSNESDPDLESFYRRQRYSPFLGDERFLARALKRAHLARAHPRAQRAPQFPTIEVVVHAVSSIARGTASDIRISRPGRQNILRDLAIYVASRIAGFPHAEIRDSFNLGSDSAITRACQRTEGGLSLDPQLRHVVDRISFAEIPAEKPP
ncbi:MAG: transposase [bacterium]